MAQLSKTVSRTAVTVAVMHVSLGTPAGAQTRALRALFDGRTLAGWYLCNGSASYSVEDATIAGRSVVNSPNRFICTRERFGDFVLEYDVWLRSPMNGIALLQCNLKVAMTVLSRVECFRIEPDGEGCARQASGL